jgi:spermidine/putrescine-binding protein
MKLTRTFLAAGLIALGVASSALAQDNKLRLITWADYVPADVVAQFKKETGIDVEITLSNNEEMISKLRATGGAGFDLAQPSQDRIVGPQQEFGIYKPIDMTKIKTELFIPSMLEATKKNTTLKGQVYGLPHIWGTDGLVVNTKLAQMSDYPDLCDAKYKGKTSMRLKRPTLLAFAFASGKDPFALYNDPKAYAALMDDVGKQLTACKGNVKFYWDNKDQLLNGARTGEIVGAMMWDTGGLEIERRESGDPVHCAEVGRARLDRHVRAAGEGPQRRGGVCVDQLQHAARDRREGRGVGRQFHGVEGRRCADGREVEGAVREELPRIRDAQRQVVSGRPAGHRGHRRQGARSR